MSKLRQFRKQAGQGMTEYIIIVALIAVAAIGVYSFFGSTIRNQTAGMASEMAGQTAKSAQDAAKTSSEAAVNSASQKKTLGNYGNEQK
jgi:Flp pilus assembly pilin Flp